MRAGISNAWSCPSEEDRHFMVSVCRLGGLAHDLLPVAARFAKSEDGLIEL